ncbi:MAG: 50S ribosomal protein L23 [Candidatus Spechtbacterales bacterium]
MALLNFLKKPKRTAESRREVYRGAEEKREEKREEISAAPVALKESRTAWRVLRAPHVTEKSNDLTRFNHYAFRVIGNPTKTEIKKAVEEIHGVHVEKVRKVSLPRKRRKRGKHFGWRPGYKKAIVVLRKGEKIEVLPH